MTPKRDESWRQSLAGETVGKYRLVAFVGAGKIGYVYRAQHRDFPDPKSERAVKLVFDTLKPNWQVELEKVMRLELVEGVVHFHESGAETLTHEGESHLAQYTVWDYIAPAKT